MLVNATPVGMYPKTDACLFMDRIPGGVVFDMVYNPRAVLIRRPESRAQP